MRSSGFPSLGLAVGLLLAACGGTTPPAASSAPPSAGAITSAGPSASTVAQASAAASAKPAVSPKPGTMIMSYSEVVGVHSTEWAAKEAGIFARNGINVDVQLIESSLGVSALLSGQTQIGSMGGSEALAADVNGADLNFYATMSPVYPYKFEAVASVKTPADLKGKKVGISRIGSSSDIATRAWFKTVGIDPDKDVSIIQIGSLQARTAALKSGALDGAMASMTDAPELEAGGLHPLVDLASAKIPAVNDCIIASRTWVSANRDAMQKFIDSIMEAYPKIHADKEFTYDLYRKYMKETDPKKLQLDYDYYVGQVIPQQPYPNSDGFKDAVEALAAQNPKAKGFDVSPFIDRSLVKSAVDRGIGQK